LPIKALLIAFIPVPAWTVLTVVCVTAAFFIAWQVNQNQAKGSYGAESPIWPFKKVPAKVRLSVTPLP
jgi:hypothetical protein